MRGERTLQRKDADLHLEASDASADECRGAHCAPALWTRQAGRMATVVATCVDRFAGVEPGPQAVAAAFAAQRQRMSALFHSLADRQWQTRSRCTEWTVQQVVRHLVDAATIDGELLRGEGP